VSHHLLVTNDFPPKVGGIQVYLWELWRRLDPTTFTVLTASSHPDHASFDAEQAARGVRIERVPGRILYFPTPSNVALIRERARTSGAGLVVLDPALPLGLAGPHLGVPYALVLHGAEVTAPGRVPGLRGSLARAVRGASLLVSAGGFAAAELAEELDDGLPPTVVVPPGVDCGRFIPLDEGAKQVARKHLGLPIHGPLVVSVSRLVPRKGMDVTIEAVRRLLPSFPDLTLAIGGRGREAGRLAREAARCHGAVRLLGAVSDEDLPLLVGAADVFVMSCRSRWFGLEEEGFGIVFVEAAAAGVAQVAGDSGGAAEAVHDGVTGVVVRRPHDPGDVALALRRLLADDGLRRRMGQAARERAMASFDYSRLAPRLAAALAGVEG
jgi:phosphatidyl-myo-inositol dimannoside synthase